jgi:transposase
MDEVKRFVGIDVAKAALDVFMGSAGAAFSVANDEVGIRELLRQLAPADFVILEATGGLEMPVASALAAAGIAVAIVNPRQVRDFARVPLAGWPRPTGWMPRCWRVSARRLDQRHGR